jgi:hypothetical protein
VVKGDDRKEVRRTAIAVIELVGRLGAALDQLEALNEEMEALLKDVDADEVALELAGMLIAVAGTYGFRLDELLAQLRSGAIGGE